MITTAGHAQKEPRFPGWFSPSEESISKITAARWRFYAAPAGWAVFRRPIATDDPLGIHGQWSGPTKLVCGAERAGGQSVEQQFELFVDNLTGREGDPRFDQDFSLEHESLVAQLCDLVAVAGKPDQKLADWEPPEAAFLSRWLGEVGCDAVIDDRQNLRFSLKRKGTTGDVRVMRERGRLRFLMPLGRFEKLDEACEHSMRRLAMLANNRTRLVRIAWRQNDGRHEVEAQVDLTGLPIPKSNRRVELFWREMIVRSATGLELVLRQLGLELPMLADPANRELIEFVCDC
jgi:hypothetical protein